MNRKATIVVLAVLVNVVVVVGIVFWLGHRKQNSQEAWRAVLNKCASTNLLGSDVVYFGASNLIGPGSVWRIARDGSYRLFYELSDLEPDVEKRKLLVITSNEVGCNGVSSTNWALNLGLPVEGPATPLSSDVAADLKQARSVNVSISGYALDQLKEGVFEDVIRKNQRISNSPGSFVVASNAIRVTGFSAELEFPESAATQIRAKYKDKLISLKDGAALRSRWSSETKLKLSAAESFYMLAGFSRMIAGKNGMQMRLAKLEPPTNGLALGNDRDLQDSIEVASVDTQAALPQTASALPVIALLGVTGLVVGVAVRWRSR